SGNSNRNGRIELLSLRVCVVTSVVDICFLLYSLRRNRSARASGTAAQSSHSTDLADSVGERARGLLWKVVPYAALDCPVGIASREFRRVRAWFRMGGAVGAS